MDENSTVFKPSELQLKWLQSSLKPDVDNTITAIAKDAGVDRKDWYNWKEIPEFMKWFTEQFNKGIADIEWWYDRAGMNLGLKDFRYYELIQTKRFNYARKIKSENLNTDTRKLDPDAKEAMDKFFKNLGNTEKDETPTENVT